jgi:hypothetical protein
MLGAAASRSLSPHRQTPGMTEKADENTEKISIEERKQSQTSLSGSRRKLPELDFSRLRKTASLLNNDRLKNHFPRDTKKRSPHLIVLPNEATRWNVTDRRAVHRRRQIRHRYRLQIHHRHHLGYHRRVRLWGHGCGKRQCQTRPVRFAADQAV